MPKLNKIPEFFPGDVGRPSEWRDRRTGLILAPGAVQNWPTSSELLLMKKSRKEMADAAREAARETRELARVEEWNERHRHKQ
jgi:hypothetical protein